MAKNYKRTQVLGGFDTLKAAQRAAEEADPAVAKPEGAKPGAKDSKKIASRINHTAMPTKHEIMCYECNYEFQITGRSPTTHCPKCRKMLEIKDYTIDGDWSETIKTAGKIHITADGVLKVGELMATDIILDGSVEDGKLRAYRWLELGAGATMPSKGVKCTNLRVGEGASIKLPRKAKYRDVEILGALKGKFSVSGTLTITSTGSLEGSVAGEHLVVEEGGGLLADVTIQPVEASAEEKPPAEQPLRKTA